MTADARTRRLLSLVSESVAINVAIIYRGLVSLSARRELWELWFPQSGYFYLSRGAMGVHLRVPMVTSILLCILLTTCGVGCRLTRGYFDAVA